MATTTVTYKYEFSLAAGGNELAQCLKPSIYRVNSGNSITNIGSTTVTATGLENPNYTLSGADNTSILLVINSGLFVKISGNWTPVKAVYKRVSGSWVQQDMTTAFSTSGRYIKSN